jgi:uncharacterized protein (TIGR03083 family)
MSRPTDTLANLDATWSALDAVAASLSPEQWAAQSLCPAWNMQGVLAHATSIEEVLVGWEPGGEAPFAGIGPAHRELAALPPDELLARFRATVAQRRADLAGLADDEFATMGPTPIGPAPYARFMEIRVFDNWVHERDIRVPLGIPGDDSGPTAEKSLDEVHNSLGYIVGKKIGLPDGSSIVFRLTGPLRRDLYVAVDGRAKMVGHIDRPDVELSTDSVTFVQLACGRIDPQEQIDAGLVRWTGNAELGNRAARNLRYTM